MSDKEKLLNSMIALLQVGDVIRSIPISRYEHLSKIHIEDLNADDVDFEVISEIKNKNIIVGMFHGHILTKIQVKHLFLLDNQIVYFYTNITDNIYYYESIKVLNE